MQKYFPSVQKKYYVEPFVGGGALLFWFLNHYGDRFEHMIANDHNRDLIEMYKTVREEVEGLIAELRDLTLAIRSSTDPYAFYLTRRSEYNSTDCTDRVRRSALLIFLNRTCFNGLYRVNREGKFNVPFGKRPFAVIYSAEILRRDSEALKKWSSSVEITRRQRPPKGAMTRRSITSTHLTVRSTPRQTLAVTQKRYLARRSRSHWHCIVRNSTSKGRHCGRIL